MSHIWTWFGIICGALIAYAAGASKDALSIVIIVSGVTLACHRAQLWLTARGTPAGEQQGC